MHLLDWIVMLGSLLGIVVYGVWRTRHVMSARSYLQGDRDMKWWTVGLSIMATQASAITFLSTPGQAYDDGMRFVQFYFGMPFAMVFLCIFVLPIYYRLNVYTAYEYLESRFDLRMRTFTALLFLIQRGLAAGITIYAPSIVLSAILGWSLNGTILFMGGVVILYTAFGGTKAVSVTQMQQMTIILTGMVIAGLLLVWQLPPDVSFQDALNVAGRLDKLNVLDFKFDPSNRYNFWSGTLGAFFLFLSYFGADQSQVSRYLTGKSLSESRLGLLFNGLLKVPMQFLILFVGILVFTFFQFTQPPLHFNQSNVALLEKTPAIASQYRQLEAQHGELFQEKQKEVRQLITAIDRQDEAQIQDQRIKVKSLIDKDAQMRQAADSLIIRSSPQAQVKDTDYVFITYVTKYLPIGIVGLLLSVIFAAGMSSTSSELNALATTTLVDIYRRSFVKDKSDRHYLYASKALTIGWGLLALFFAITARLFENLIQAVNIIGSVFYGVILGIFITAFFLKKVQGRAVFYAAIIAEAVVITVYFLDKYDIFKLAFLWFNLLGCGLVMLLALLFQGMSRRL
ncbi:MAG: sodium:solute symporter [Saprospiraceae bacterium]|nr:sodium:solute symporter [Saprospiraceae bacterium]